jgi:hypothetical protein
MVGKLLLRRHLRRTAWGLWRDVGGLFITANGSLGENPSGAQCVNVPNFLWDRLGIPQLFGNAADWVGSRSYHTKWLVMGEGLRLFAGDVVVWSSDGAPPDGHVDVVLDGSRVPFLGMDQNYPLGSPVHLQSHIKNGAAGVIRVVR